ncbi:hypothetical protein H6769_01630 [Candidatus Peribacteria bacterium]|nr:hypothetical protein [Candidatus Peribacteria bacterium]
MEVIRAVQVRVLKGGKPVSGVKVYYSKSTIGGWGDKKTDDQGYVIFQISAGETSLLTITGKGISYEIKGYHLKNGLNEFRF